MSGKIERAISKRLASVSTLDEIAEILYRIINSDLAVFSENGRDFFTNTRAEFARIKGLKISIYSDEHAPPHFHVTYGSLNGIFRLDDCTPITGNIPPSKQKIIRHFHLLSKQKMIEFWDSKRPTDCVVGSFGVESK